MCRIARAIVPNFPQRSQRAEGSRGSASSTTTVKTSALPDASAILFVTKGYVRVDLTRRSYRARPTGNSSMETRLESARTALSSGVSLRRRRYLSKNARE